MSDHLPTAPPGSAGAERPSDPAWRHRAVVRVLVVTLGLNLAAAAVKLVAGAVSGSLALTAGGVDSLYDGGANVFGLIALRAAAQPPDAEHPYGHRKFETLVAAVIAVLLFVTCGRLVWGALQSMLEIVGGAPGPSVTWTAVLTPALAATFNTLASTYESRWGRRLGSELLIADAGHTRADAWVSAALVLGLVAVRAGYPVVDPVLALVIAGVVARTGLAIVYTTSNVLADAAVFDPALVAATAHEVPGVAGTHKVRSRGPAGAAAIDLHVQVDPELDIARAHAIGHAVEARLRERLPGVVEVLVHVEPDGEDRPGIVTRSAT